MSSSTGSVEEKIRLLPPDLREEAIHYIDELVKRSKRSPPASFRCAAEGTLAEIGKRYWGKHFWGRGFFSTTSGNITDEMINDYINGHMDAHKSDNERNISLD